MSFRLCHRSIIPARLSLGALLVLPTLSLGASDSDSSSPAGQLVSQALQAEADGELLLREKLLTEAVQLDARCEPANWYKGKLLGKDSQWQTIDESVAESKSSDALAEYEKVRAKQPNTVTGHWQMAMWCAQKNLPEQCRAHLESIVRVEPDHAAARQALGYQLVGDEWISPERIAELAQSAQVAQEAVAKYGAEVRKLLRQATSDNEPAREAAMKELESLDDPGVVAVLELVASQQGDEVARVVVQLLGKSDTVEASKSLARFAVQYPVASVREAAAAQLKEKSYFDYMPDLLAAMTSPIQVALVPLFDRRGNVTGYQQAFAKEGVNENRVQLVNQTLTFRRARDPVNQMLQQSAAESIALAAQVRNQTAQQENVTISANNRRIVYLISEITGEEFPNTPRDVWTWWDRYNENNFQAYKPVRYQRSNLNLTVPEYQLQPPVHPECFAAGTLVTTRSGQRPIETITVGDQVLTRNAVSGELCWKPVILGTTRPPEPTVRLDVDEGHLQCTRGHLLWVSGKGWTKASEIKAGDLLHTASEPAVVLAVKDLPPVQTYNLEVADNHSYFVGDSRVLSHDVTARGSLRDRIPGQNYLAGILTATR